MKTLLFAVFVLVVGCTKANPNRCCVDAADCTANSIAIGSTCDDGLLCRGHQCISIPCTTSSQCDVGAPYCAAQACAEQCSDNTECPGASQDPTRMFCVDASCVQCRTSGDCAGTTPVCDQGTCVACSAHSDCASGVCKPDGACAIDSEIAFVATNGTSGSDCTKLAPCSTLNRALSLLPAREFILVSAGTYTSTTETTFTGQRYVVGSGTTKPVFTRSTAGPIFSLQGGVQVTFDNVAVTGATAASGDGYGFRLSNTGGSPTLTLLHADVSGNATGAVFGRSCTFNARNTTFTMNNGIAIEIIDSTGNIDSCLVAQNRSGLILDSGLFSVTNSMIVRNYSPSSTTYGISLFSGNPGNRIEFNTIADNSDGLSSSIGAGVECNLSGSPQAFPNNIIVRNRQQTSGTTCSFGGSILLDGDPSSIKFKSPDVAPYDYHIMAGSLAVDAATASTLDHDFDGDARPAGAQRDIGADELAP